MLLAVRAFFCSFLNLGFDTLVVVGVAPASHLLGAALCL